MAAAAPETRLQGAFALEGVVSAHGVRGERTGQRVRRTWTFVSSCPSGPCPMVLLARQRGGGQTDVLTVARVGPGVYAGRGRFWVPLRCAGRLVVRGGEVPFTVTVRVTAVAVVQGVPFATALAARYDNPRRINRTRCPGGIGHDAARYAGALAVPVPGPPQASLAAALTGPSTVSFRDASTPGAGGAPVTRRAWDFGDPASGAADTSEDPAPTHTYSAPGTYAVTLTVTDANGLTATTSAQVTT